MAKQEEYEIEESDAEKTVKYFGGESTEEDLRSIYELKTEIASLDALVEEKIRQVKEQNKGMENVQRGKYVASLKTVSGRVTTDWKQAYKDAVGEMPGADASKYIKKSDDSVRLEVRRIDG